MKHFSFNHLTKLLLITFSILIVLNACKDEDENDIINQHPIITIETPENNATFIEGDSVTLTCTATDNEDGELENQNIEWSSNQDGILGNGILLNTSSLTVATHQIIAKATDSEGLDNTDTIEIVIIDDENPTVSISHPANQAVYEYNELLTFKCEANDVEDGILEGTSIQWDSNINGTLGEGDSLIGISLTAGIHQITVTATDSKGNTANDVISITINENNLPTIEISRPFANHTYLTGEIELKCTATDPEDGELLSEYIQWTSNIDGVIGYGNDTLATLTAGSHEIIATAIDSNGDSSSDTVYIEVVTGPLTLEIMVQWMIGSYSSEAQAASSSDPYHYDVRRKTSLIWENNKDGYWLYLEQAYAESQSNPYFQRVYHFYYDGETIKNTIYALNNPANFVGSWATPEDFDVIDIDDLTERPNCGLTFQINNNHIFGETSGTSCTSSIPGVAYMSSEQWIYDTKWHSYDLGYNDQGVIVMGPYSPYIFDKVTN